MKTFVIICVAALILMMSSAASASIEWKGITWDVANGTAVVNGDGSLTLTSTAASSSGVSLHVNRLSDGFGDIRDPWVQWSFTGHKADILIEYESLPGPTIQAGSLWDNQWAVTRYTDGTTRPEQYFIWAADSTSPISHDVSLGKHTDGTVDAKFDANAWATTEFLKTNVGGNWGFNDVYLRMRDAAVGDTVTFNDFQFGSGYVPEPATLCLLGLGGLLLRKRRA